MPHFLNSDEIAELCRLDPREVYQDCSMFVGYCLGCEEPFRTEDAGNTFCKDCEAIIAEITREMENDPTIETVIVIV